MIAFLWGSPHPRLRILVASLPPPLLSNSLSLHTCTPNSLCHSSAAPDAWLDCIPHSLQEESQHWLFTYLRRQTHTPPILLLYAELVRHGVLSHDALARRVIAGCLMGPLGPSSPAAAVETTAAKAVEVRSASAMGEAPVPAVDFRLLLTNLPLSGRRAHEATQRHVLLYGVGVQAMSLEVAPRSPCAVMPSLWRGISSSSDLLPPHFIVGWGRYASRHRAPASNTHAMVRGIAGGA